MEERKPGAYVIKDGTAVPDLSDEAMAAREAIGAGEKKKGKEVKDNVEK